MDGTRGRNRRARLSQPRDRPCVARARVGGGRLDQTGRSLYSQPSGLPVKTVSLSASLPRRACPPAIATRHAGRALPACAVAVIRQPVVCLQRRRDLGGCGRSGSSSRWDGPAFRGKALGASKARRARPRARADGGAPRGCPSRVPSKPVRGRYRTACSIARPGAPCCWRIPTGCPPRRVERSAVRLARSAIPFSWPGAHVAHAVARASWKRPARVWTMPPQTASVRARALLRMSVVLRLCRQGGYSWRWASPSAPRRPPRLGRHGGGIGPAAPVAARGKPARVASSATAVPSRRVFVALGKPERELDRAVEGDAPELVRYQVGEHLEARDVCWTIGPSLMHLILMMMIRLSSIATVPKPCSFGVSPTISW